MTTLLSSLRLLALFLIGFGATELFIGSVLNTRFLSISDPLLTLLSGALLLSVTLFLRSFSSRPSFAPVPKASLLGLVFVAFVAFAWMGWSFYEPDGTYTASYDFSSVSGSEPISGLGPGGRVSPRTFDFDRHVAYQDVREDLAYFTVDLPREFADIAVTIDYENTSHQAIDLGLQTAVSDWSFENRLLELKAADEAVFNGWTEQAIGDDITQLSHPDYADRTLQELATSPDVSIGLLNAPRPLFSLPETPYPTAAPTDYVFPLRGSHDFYIHVPEGEVFSFDAQFDTLDPAFDMPPLSLSLYSFDTEIVSAANTFIQDPERKRILLESEPLPEGIYRLHVGSTDRVLLRRFAISHQRFVFKSLTLAASPDYLDEIPDIPIFPSTLYSSSTDLSFQTVHEVGLQTLRVGAEPVEIRSTHTFQAWSTDETESNQHTVRAIHFPVSDMFVKGNEWFAFSQAQYFDPDFETVFLSTAIPEETDMLSVLLFSSDYIASPKNPNDHLRSRTATFPLHTLQLKDPTKLQFVLSSSGFQSGLDPIRVDRIHVRATKPPFSLSRLWQRITHSISE